MQNRERWNFAQTFALELIRQRGFWWVIGVAIIAHYGAPLAAPTVIKVFEMMRI